MAAPRLKPWPAFTEGGRSVLTLDDSTYVIDTQEQAEAIHKLTRWWLYSEPYELLVPGTFALSISTSAGRTAVWSAPVMGAFGIAILSAISGRLQRSRQAKLRALVASLGLLRLAYDKAAPYTGFLPPARLDYAHLQQGRERR